MLRDTLNLQLEYNNTIFGKSGLTITSANNIANIAKEMYSEYETFIKNLKFLNIDFTQSNSEQQIRIQNASTKDQVLDSGSFLTEIYHLKGLIAYLREALTLKNEMLSFYQYYDENNFKEDLEKVGMLDKYPYFNFKSKIITASNNFKTNLLKEDANKIASYFTNEAAAATFGDLIHKNGYISDLRNDFNKKHSNPISIENINDIIHCRTYSSDLDYEFVNSFFYKLQSKHRDAQKKVNSVKFEIENKISNAETEALSKNKMINQEFQYEKTKVTSDVAIVRKEFLDEVKELKIKIPDNLKSIYDKVQSKLNESII